MKFHRLLGVSILPALLVMPAMAVDFEKVSGNYNNFDISVSGSNDNSAYYSYKDTNNKYALFSVMTEGDVIFRGDKSVFDGVYPYSSFKNTSRFVTFGVDADHVASFLADDTTLSASGDGVSGQWGMALEVGNRTDKTKTATAVFQGRNDVNLNAFWKNYTAQTLTVRSNGEISFENTGDVVIDAKGIFGATGITQQGKMTVDIDGDFSVNAGYAEDIDAEYDSSKKMSGTNAVPVQIQGDLTDISAKNVNFNSYGQGYNYKPNSSNSDGSIGLELSYGGMSVKADKFNINVISTAETDEHHFDSYGILFEDSDDSGSLSVNGITSINVATNGNAYGVVMTAADDRAEFNDELNITANAKGVANGIVLSAGEMTTKSLNVIANTAEGQSVGVSIADNAVLNIKGDVNVAVFGNDESVQILNNGSLNIQSDSNMLSDVSGTGSLNIGKGATLNIGTASIEQGTITLNGDMFATLRDGDDAQITASEIAGNGKLNLTISKAGKYHVFGKEDFENILSANAVYELSALDGGYIEATVKSTEEIASNTHIAHESAAAVSHIASAASVSESKQLQELSLKLQEKLANGDTASVEHATQAIHPETESVAQSVSSSVQNTVVNAAAARMAMPAIGRSGGDVNLTSGAVWAQGIFNKSKQNDAFHGYTRGIAVGLDGTINKVWTIGAAYSFAHSDVTGSARDTEIDSNTLFLYGQYKPSEWYLNAIANYTWSDYSEKGSVIDDALVFADYDVQSFGGHIATGYNFDNGITPELGLRYMHVNADDYTNSYGIKTSMKDTDFLTGMAGAKYAFDITSGKHAKFTPELKAGVKYDLLSDKSVATIAMPGVDAYAIDGGRLNRFGGEFGIGLGMTYDNLQLSVNYDIDVRKDYTSQTGMLKFRYSF